MKTEIQIVLAGLDNGWRDNTHGTLIGDGDRLVLYVNMNKFRVTNEDTFVRRGEFWYNQKGSEVIIRELDKMISEVCGKQGAKNAILNGFHNYMEAIDNSEKPIAMQGLLDLLEEYGLEDRIYIPLLQSIYKHFPTYREQIAKCNIDSDGEQFDLVVI